ncbi:hypothetical protein [Saccharothrix syringae]|uniref:Uncharacterized protein n=1 Tax=Saccharothrix syringae TaxID=103733 RepID=A0A5Q0GWP5_SACSY|nr:hypothetical protein [Saccharothrix syringae]QFZ18313.1 hypothetical protein EKG83_13200 [Saccharothrix syringae]
MTATAEPSAAAPELDTAGLLAAYRRDFTPAAKAFVEGGISARELRERWLPYFRGPFLDYELSVQAAWRAAHGPDRGIEPGPPDADPAHAEQLRHFPVTISHNNLERLVDVLAVELGDRTAADTVTPERVLDLAHVVDALDRLMHSLVLTP